MYSSTKGGFTLIEALVILAVLALLAGLAVPMIGESTSDARIAKVLTGISDFQKACHRYYADTRTYPIEIANREGIRFHQLSMRQDKVVGWKGPYLGHLLTSADNPFQADVVIMNDLNSAGRFDLDGDGAPDAEGPGNCVVYENVDELSAQQIDHALDGSLERRSPDGAEPDWRQSGRVKWTANKRLTVLLQHTYE